ncbi:MAG: ImmA/IrrE family metallo-endopeptidase [Pseudonocardiaceae bacterium]
MARLAHARRFALSDGSNAAKLGGANDRTDFTNRTITVRDDIPELARCKTLTHELGHVLLHDPDSNDSDEVRDALSHRGRAEVEAESVAFMVLTAHGIASDECTFPYVATWAATENGGTGRRRQGNRRTRTSCTRSLRKSPPSPAKGAGSGKTYGSPRLQGRRLLEPGTSRTRARHLTRSTIPSCSARVVT